MATKRENERIAVLETKFDDMNDKLDNHIESQDKFEAKVLENLGDLTLVLKAFRAIGWFITIVIGAGTVWIVNTFLNRG